MKFATSLLISNSNLNPYTNETIAGEKTFSTFVFGKKKSKLKTNSETPDRMISTAIPETMVGQNGQIVGEKMDLGYKPIKKEAEELMVSSKLKLKNIVADDFDGNEDESYVSRSESNASSYTYERAESLANESRPLPSIKPEQKLPTIEKETFKEPVSKPPPPPPIKGNIPAPPKNMPPPPPPPVSSTTKPSNDLKNLPKPQANRSNLLEEIRNAKNKSNLRPISSALESNKELPPIPGPSGSSVKRSEKPKLTHVSSFQS